MQEVYGHEFRTWSLDVEVSGRVCQRGGREGTWCSKSTVDFGRPHSRLWPLNLSKLDQIEVHSIRTSNSMRNVLKFTNKSSVGRLEEHDWMPLSDLACRTTSFHPTITKLTNIPHASPARFPTNIRWFGGTKIKFVNVTRGQNRYDDRTMDQNPYNLSDLVNLSKAGSNLRFSPHFQSPAHPSLSRSQKEGGTPRCLSSNRLFGRGRTLQSYSTCLAGLHFLQSSPVSSTTLERL